MLSSFVSKQIISDGLKDKHCLTSSEPIEPPAPVISTRLPRRIPSIEFISSFTSSLPNKSEYDEYIARRDAAKKAKDSELTMKEDLDNLKGEINEIKSLLKELVRGN